MKHRMTEGRASSAGVRRGWASLLASKQAPPELVRHDRAHWLRYGVAFEDRAERELLELARQIRELDGQEEQLVDLRLAKTITPAVLERKAKAVQGQREQLRLRMEAVRAERAAAARAVEESTTVRRLLRELRPVAERIGTDPARRAEIVGTVTKGVVVHTAAGRQRLDVTYAFAQPVVGERVAASPTV